MADQYPCQVFPYCAYKQIHESIAPSVVKSIASSVVASAFVYLETKGLTQHRGIQCHSISWQAWMLHPILLPSSRLYHTEDLCKLSSVFVGRFLTLEQGLFHHRLESMKTLYSMPLNPFYEVRITQAAYLMSASGIRLVLTIPLPANTSLFDPDHCQFVPL